MGVRILISDTKFFNEYKNDPGFVSNLGDTTVNLTGSVMENVKVTQNLDISWDSTSTTADVWDHDATASTFTRTIGSFIQDGFTVGDSFDYIDYPGGAVLWSGTIDSISDLFILYSFVSGAAPTNGTLTADGIAGTTPLTALVYRFGLIGNSENFNTISKASGSDQGYVGKNIGFDTGGGVRSLSTVGMAPLGPPYTDWRTSVLDSNVDMTVAYVSNPTTHAQRFFVTHEFTIVPWYVDGELPNLQNNDVPELLKGANSLKYVFNAGFRDVFSNPNSEKSEEKTQTLGSVAWFNQNFNDFPNDYSVLSVAYEDQATTDPATGILVTTKTKITATIERVGGSFSGAERFGAYISYLPAQDEYQNKSTNLKSNFIYDRALNSAGLGGVAGEDFITDCSATIVSGDLIVVVECEYAAGQKAFLSTNVATRETNFLLGIQVGDNTLTSANSDRVMLLADVTEYDATSDVAGLITFTKFDIYSHEQQIGVDTPTTNKTVWNEDGVVIDFAFDLDLNKSAKINTLNFPLIAYNPSTGDSFDLDTFSYAVGQSVISGGVQQLNASTTRGYILKVGDQFNDVTLQTDGNAGGIQSYSGRFAQKFSWQDWISNLDVDNTFFDITEPNDNKNDQASNYSLLSGYEIRLAVTANLDGVSPEGVSSQTDYLIVSPTITVFDYEDDGNITPIWSHVIETFNTAPVAAVGTSVLTGVNTLFRTTWTNSGGAVASLAGIYGINRIEETLQPGYEITEMSSLNDPAASQLLIPSTGTKLDMTIVGGNVVKIGRAHV